MTAPHVRRVNAFTGQVAPTKYFQALSEADHFVRELDGLRETQCHIQELTAENLSASYEAHDITRGLLAAANREIARIKSERDTLRAQVSAGVR